MFDVWGRRAVAPTGLERVTVYERRMTFNIQTIAGVVGA